jgi:hypothetical protein
MEARDTSTLSQSVSVKGAVGGLLKKGFKPHPNNIPSVETGELKPELAY